MEHRDVGGVQHHNRLAIVASLFHEPARALEVRLARSPGARSVLAFADEVRAALPIVLCLADGGLQVALLVDHVRERLPRLLIVEGWLEMVRADPPLVADDVVGDDADGRVALDLGDVVQGRLLPEVNLACLKRRGGGRGVGDVTPDEAVNVHALTAGGAAGRLVARDVVGIAHVDDLVARLPLLLDELVGTRPDRLLDHVLFGRGRDARGKDERHHGGGLGQGLQDKTEGLTEFQRETLLVGRLQPLGRRNKELAERIPLAPATQRDDAVLGGHRLAVVELEPVAECKAPLAPVGADGPRVDHLRPDLALLILREERVVDEVGVRAVRDVPRVACHVEDAEVRVRYEAQRAAGLLGVHERRRERQGGGSGGAADEELTPTRLMHDVVLPDGPRAIPRSSPIGRRADPMGIWQVTSPAHASCRWSLRHERQQK